MSTLHEQDHVVTLDFNRGLEYWSITGDGKFLSLSRAGLIVVVPIPSAAVWAKLAELAARAGELVADVPSDPYTGEAVHWDYREQVKGASK